ncbi:MAG: hypothetical protein ABWX71_02510 [Aeromicrobium sp.]
MAERFVHIEARELARLELDLRDAPGRVRRAITETIASKAGPLLAREMRKDARGHRGTWFGKPGTSFATHLERHVSHEMLDENTVEAGIENKGAGRLGGIIAYGTVNNPGGAYDAMAGPRRAMPRIARMFEQVAEESVLGDTE